MDTRPEPLARLGDDRDAIEAPGLSHAKRLLFGISGSFGGIAVVAFLTAAMTVSLSVPLRRIHAFRGLSAGARPNGDLFSQSSVSENLLAALFIAAAVASGRPGSEKPDACVSVCFLESGLVLSHPSFISDEAIAQGVATHWLPEIVDISYLPWGFGAHHWRATGGGATLFVTLDQLGPRHTAPSLEAAYAGAAALAATGLDTACAALPARSGRFTVDVGAGVLSVTPWLEGRSPTEVEAREPGHVREVVLALAALHRAAPPDGLRSWTPQVGPEFADELRARTAKPWTSGPLAEQARVALAAHDEVIQGWTSRYLELAEIAFSRRDSWVPTHGEPHNDNQVMTAHGLRLVDWESLALAPPERDYADLLAAADLLLPDPAMVELFTLDWRLSEIAEYARWFAAPHTGTDDDHTAMEGLYEELAGGVE